MATDITGCAWPTGQHAYRAGTCTRCGAVQGRDIVSVATRVMVDAGDMSPAAREMGAEAWRQWAVANGADECDTVYVLAAAYVRGTVTDREGDDYPWADDMPTRQDVREAAALLFGFEPWNADASVDAWEGGALDSPATGTIGDHYAAMSATR